MISNCFPFLEELDLGNPKIVFNVAEKAMLLKLPKLRKVILSGHHYAYGSLLFHMCKNCEFLQEVVMSNNYCIPDKDIASAIRERPGLKSISFTRMTFGNHCLESLASLMGLACLDLSYTCISDKLLSSVAEKGHRIRRLVLQGCLGYTYGGIYNLLSKCQFIQYLDLQNANFMSDGNVIELSSFLGDLVSINISNCASITHLTLFALLRSCAKLADVKMEYTSIGKMSVENSYTFMYFGVYPQLKSPRLAHNIWLKDEDINMLAFVFPNIQLLDLSCCNHISKEGIGQVLRKSSKIRHLNVAYCSRLKQVRMNFKVATLVVLNLSKTGIYDRSLYMISTSCFALLHLDLGYCYNVTEKGVMKVVENCKQLREINLQGCRKMVADIVDSMVLIRPSLRKITAPPCFCCTNSERKLFLHHGCLVC